MSDSQVDTELRKMTAFIRQEALEKAREIQLKADEEFSIEKSKLVRQETQRIDAEYEKKHKQAGMSQQITASTLANRQRLRLLASKQELLDGLFEQAGKKLAETVGSGNGGGNGGKKGKKNGGAGGVDYESVLKGLVLEGLYALVESKISIRCRKKDTEVVKKAIESAKKEYSENLKGREVEVTVDDKENLPEESAGGVIIFNGTGKIEINNTFEERLKLLETDALPSVRLSLFGENENRRFKD
ncbi:hypothetical protein Q7P35_003329 [Cladosporium inversicolor]